MMSYTFVQCLLSVGVITLIFQGLTQYSRETLGAAGDNLDHAFPIFCIEQE